MQKVEITMTKERETKRTNRYLEDGDEDDYKIQTLYLKKKVGSPTRIKVTIEEAS